MADIKADKIKLDRQGIRALLQSPEMMAAIKSEAHKQGQIVKDYVGFDRVHAVVKRNK